MTTDPRPSFSRTRKVLLGLNTLIGLGAALALVVMLNYLAARYFFRTQWSADLQAGLSPRTLRVLESLTNNVKVIVYFDKNDSLNNLYEPVSSLLKEYKHRCSKIQLEEVDYLRDPVSASLIQAKYPRGHITDKNLVIFDSGGRTEFVRESELSEYDYQKLLTQETNEVHRTHFKGELLFTSAIYGLAHPRSLKAYFLQGHGEHDPAGTDSPNGYSDFAALLREINIKFDALTLVGTGDVPADCNLLIIPGPTDALLKEELEKIESYLNQGGRLLLLLNFYSARRQTGLEKTLAKWGVAVGNNMVIDDPNTAGNFLATSRFGSHPVTRGLLRSRLLLFRPRSIDRIPKNAPVADAPKVEELAWSGPKSVVVTDIREGTHRFGENDRKGETPLMVAVERGEIKGVNAERGSTRIVVTGDSFFLGNGPLNAAEANRDFAVQAVSWLLDRAELLAGIGPHPVKSYKLAMTTSEMAAARALLLLGMPGLILVVGLLVWARRRK
jgi:ABC-type uncharacterized transport system involved in gliding motility auxiliary subunit